MGAERIGDKEKRLRELREARSNRTASPSQPTVQTVKESVVKKKPKQKIRTAIKTKTSSKKITKTDQIVKLLQRAEGCTTADVLKETGWPSVSMPQMAKAAGITLATEKTGRITRYWDKATKPKAA